MGQRLPAVPAVGGPGQHHRRRPRPGTGARADRGDGRHPPAGPDPGRRADHGALIGGRVTKVLIVDDEPQILRALRINLRAREYDVEVAASGAGALKTAAAYHPDLIVLDLGLPDMDGVDVI